MGVTNHLLTGIILQVPSLKQIAPENGGWKMNFLLGWPICRGYVVSFRERVHIPPNRKAGKSSTRKCRLGKGHGTVPWRVTSMRCVCMTEKKPMDFLWFKGSHHFKKFSANYAAKKKHPKTCQKITNLMGQKQPNQVPSLKLTVRP